MSWLTTTRPQEINKLADNALERYKKYRDKDIEVESKSKRMRSQIEAIYPTIEHQSPEQTEVGKYYKVLCARLTDPDRRAHIWLENEVKNWPEWIPTLGPVHDDTKELDFPHIHIHLDLRFFSKTVITDSNAYAYMLRPLILYLYISGNYRLSCQSIEWAVKRLQCKRETPVFQEKNIRNLESYYKKACLGRDGLCPHRGIPIKCGTTSSEGITTCPGHGLRWNQQGALVETPVEQQGVFLRF